jgi:16S rRNA (cytosine967-C5)-methyltransferase
MATNTRFTAIEILKRHQQTRLPVTGIFDSVVRKFQLSQADRQLVMKITYGVLRQRDYLDLVLDSLCRRPITQLKPFVYQALSTGLYQLLFLDRIPPSAAVNETVKAVQQARLPKQVQGFVNGVLRQSLRQRGEFPDPESGVWGTTPVLNHPDWLTDRWQAKWGRQAMLDICAHNNREPELCLRLAPGSDREAIISRLREADIEALPGSYSPSAVLLPNCNGPVTELPGFPDGLFQVQDQAAQLATLLLNPIRPGDTYLDACAGLGGKTTHLVSLLAGAGGHVSAVEPDSRRYRLLLDNLTRTSATGPVSTFNGSLAEFAKTAPAPFTGVLVDAPCSGTGVIGRHPDIRWNREEIDLTRYHEQQLDLLNRAAALVAPGGTLVYATCSLEPEENVEVVKSFLTHNTSFSATDCRDYLPAEARILVSENYFAPLPGPGLDGFFAARLTKIRNND